jgi:hypothetical protein
MIPWIPLLLIIILHLSTTIEKLIHIQFPKYNHQMLSWHIM